MIITEVNEKLVNDIMLLTVAKQSSLFIPSQISILEFVANQCPVSGGLAVFRARALLSLSNPNQHFDDRAICEPFGGIRIGNTSNSILNNLKIYPNPAMNKVTLELNSEIYEDTQFLMFNTSGQKVLEKQLLSNQKIFNFDISDIKPGVYQYQLITKNQYYANGKLIIIR